MTTFNKHGGQLMDKHHRHRPYRRDNHVRDRRGFDPHRREGGFDSAGQSLSEIRRRVRGEERGELDGDAGFQVDDCNELGG